MDDNKNKDEEEVNEDGESGEKQNKLVTYAVMAILMSAAFYFFVLKSPETQQEAPEEDVDEIIISDGGVQPLQNQDIDFNATDTIDSTIPSIPDFDLPDTQDAIPALPEIPDLPDNIRQQITESINPQPQPTEPTEPTYTKEEVDKIIAERLEETLLQERNRNIELMQQQNRNNQNLIPSINQNNDTSDVNIPNVSGGIGDIASLQKNRALKERRGGSIFSVIGNTMPTNSMPQDEDAMILTYVDSKLDIPVKTSDVLPVQISDLTRTMLQGKIINAALETAIDTDIPSDVRAVIIRDVFAEEGKNILIPKGSRIIGTYTSNLQAGQKRVTINWNRIIRVDGMSLNIASIAADRLGRAGIQGEVDNKYAQRLANTFLSSVLSVGSSIAVENITGSTGISSTVSSLTGETTETSGQASDYALINATQEFMDEAQDIVDEIANQGPTIRIPQGERITVMVTQDVTLPVYKY